MTAVAMDARPASTQLGPAAPRPPGGNTSTPLADAMVGIAGALRGYVEYAAPDWRYQRIVQELHLWGERFTVDFALEIPIPVLAVERLRKDTLGQYTLGRSAIGTRTTVTLNERWIASRPFQDTLITLVHELVHAWDEWRRRRPGPLPPITAGGHGKPWREKMAEVGVVTGRRGATVEITPELQAWFDRYGVPRLEDLLTPQPPPTTQRQLPKWVCRCPPRGNPVRAVYLHARCLDCGAEYDTPEAAHGQ